MSEDTTHPIVIVGAGPAGTSAALALRNRGKHVHILDAGEAKPVLPPEGSYLDLRATDPGQWLWQIGEQGSRQAETISASPKLRVPGLRPLFDGYAQANRLRAEDGFQMVGALGAGGLSTAWGCGVARFEDDELGPLRSERESLDASYAVVAKRMGLSGASDDALRDAIGVDDWSAPALPLDALHERLWSLRERLPANLAIGRARVAVLDKDRGDRRGCDLSGMCLWGCARRATWSASFDADILKRDPAVVFETGVLVQALESDERGGWRLTLIEKGMQRHLHARTVILAAGTLASTRLAWRALANPPEHLRLQSNPMAAFLLAMPKMLGAPRLPAFGLAQLSWRLERESASPVYGNLFSTTGLPISEFLQHIPLTRRAGLPLLRALLPATVVGNAFLPGASSQHSLCLSTDGTMTVRARHGSTLTTELEEVRSSLNAGLRRLGAWMLPGSFVPGAPGADLHYAATMPHSLAPEKHECRIDGQIAGLPGVYLVDGAALPVLPAKSHTLTIMANAHRIATGLP